jgi:hypothetical protein
MPRKTFVYPHPINAYIIKQLGITVEEFCELHAFSQGTVSSWITRQKKIETLPISFIYSLSSLSASQTMDQVYSDLLKLQDDYLLHLERHRRTKKLLNENTFLLSYYFTTRNKNTRAMFVQHFLCFYFIKQYLLFLFLFVS